MFSVSPLLLLYLLGRLLPINVNLNREMCLWLRGVEQAIILWWDLLLNRCRGNGVNLHRSPLTVTRLRKGILRAVCCVSPDSLTCEIIWLLSIASKHRFEWHLFRLFGSSLLLLLLLIWSETPPNLPHNKYLILAILMDYYITLRGCRWVLRIVMVGGVYRHVQLFTWVGRSYYRVSARYLVSLHVLTQKFLPTSYWLNHHWGIHILQQKCTNIHVGFNCITIIES